MRLLPDLVLVDGRFEAGRAVEIADGRITGVAAFPSAWGDAAFADDLVRLPGRALLPGTVNAHCHTFQSLLRGLGDDMDFMSWRDRVLYPFSTRLDRDGIYLGAAFAFAEMLLHGATTCVDFFYLQDAGNENARAVIQAARDTGIRHPRTNLLKNVVYAMSPQAVTDVWVHGQPVVRGRRLATLDQDALMARVRALTHDWRLA